MKIRHVTFAVALFILFLSGGLGQALAQGEDPNLIPGTIDSTSIGSLIPVLVGGGSDTVFFLYSTTAGLSTSSPRRVKIEFHSTTGALVTSGTVSITANSGSVIKTASALGATGDGVAVLTPVTAEGSGTTGHYGGSVFYLDGTLGVTYERPLIMGRGTGNTWPAFSDFHSASFVQSGVFSTRLHILCPGDSSATSSSSSALNSRIQALGTLSHTSTSRTKHFDLTVFSDSGAVVGTATGFSCDGENFRSVAASSLSGLFASIGSGLFRIVGSTASASAHADGEATGDLIVWRNITISISGLAPFVLDARAQIRR